MFHIGTPRQRYQGLIGRYLSAVQHCPAGAAEQEDPPHRRVAGIFPGREAIIRLVGAVLAEQNDEWTEARRYIGLEILAACRKLANNPETSEAGVTIESISA